MANKKEREQFADLPFLEEMQEYGVPCSIKTFGEKIVQHYKNPELRKDAILAVGESGAGKTQIVFQAAKQLDVDIIYLNLTASGKEDVVGWPIIKSKYPEYDSTDINSMLKAMLSGSKYYDMDLMELLKPLVDPKTKAVVLLDEIAQIGTDVQRAIFPIMQERRIGNKPISDGILIVGTMNPTNKSEYMLNKMQKAMQERFNIYVIKPVMSEWITYGLENGFNKDVISYVKKNPSVFTQTNPRRLEKLSKIVNATDLNETSDEMFHLSIQSVLGPGKANEFIKHIKQLLQNSLIPSEILRDKYTIKDIEKAFDKSRTNFGVLFHRMQSDLLVILENPTGYSEVFGNKVTTKSIKTAAAGIMKLCVALKNRNDFDLTVGLLKGVLGSVDASIKSEFRDQLGTLVSTDDDLTEKFLMAAGVKDHLTNLQSMVTEVSTDDK
jgi:MoxR-like ATPase